MSLVLVAGRAALGMVHLLPLPRMYAPPSPGSPHLSQYACCNNSHFSSVHHVPVSPFTERVQTFFAVEVLVTCIPEWSNLLSLPLSFSFHSSRDPVPTTAQQWPHIKVPVSKQQSLRSPNLPPGLGLPHVPLLP